MFLRSLSLVDLHLAWQLLNHEGSDEWLRLKRLLQETISFARRSKPIETELMTYENFSGILFPFLLDRRAEHGCYPKVERHGEGEAIETFLASWTGGSRGRQVHAEPAWGKQPLVLCSRHEGGTV